MQIDKIILNAIEKKSNDLGVTFFAREANVNYRSVRKVIETGECTPQVYKKLCKYISKEEAKKQKLINQLQEDNN